MQDIIFSLLSPSTFQAPLLVAGGWLAALWLGLLVWITRDSLARSDSVLFHMISVILGFGFVPGWTLYLLIRPRKTLDEEFAEEKRRREYLTKFGVTAGECQACHHPVREQDTFCENCGTALRIECGSCGGMNHLGASYCSGCGASRKEMELRRKVEKVDAKKVARKIGAARRRKE